MSWSKANLILYNTNINACGKAALWQRATCFLGELDQKSLEPNVVTTSAAISALEKAALELEDASKAQYDTVQTTGYRKMAILIWKTQYRSRHFLGSLFFERCAIQYRALERGQCSLNDTAKKSERHSHLMYAIDVLVNLQVKCMFLCFCSQFARPGNGLCSSLARRKWT